MFDGKPERLLFDKFNRRRVTTRNQMEINFKKEKIDYTYDRRFLLVPSKDHG
jgi:hypothetical protein